MARVWHFLLLNDFPPPSRSLEQAIDNRVQLNSEKCKELRISFTKKLSEFHPILVNGNQLEAVRSAKLLGVIITSDLSWNEHINETVKKASKRLYFLVQLKRAKLPCRDLVLFYATCIRSILFMPRLFSFMLCPSIHSKYAIQPLAVHVFIFNQLSNYLSM